MRAEGAHMVDEVSLKSCERLELNRYTTKSLDPYHIVPGVDGVESERCDRIPVAQSNFSYVARTSTGLPSE